MYVKSVCSHLYVGRRFYMSERLPAKIGKVNPYMNIFLSTLQNWQVIFFPDTKHNKLPFSPYLSVIIGLFPYLIPDFPERRLKQLHIFFKKN